jgi:hypothetical protein
MMMIRERERFQSQVSHSATGSDDVVPTKPEGEGDAIGAWRFHPTLEGVGVSVCGTRHLDDGANSESDSDSGEDEESRESEVGAEMDVDTRKVRGRGGLDIWKLL